MNMLLCVQSRKRSWRCLWKRSKRDKEVVTVTVFSVLRRERELVEASLLLIPYDPPSFTKSHASSVVLQVFLLSRISVLAKLNTGFWTAFQSFPTRRRRTRRTRKCPNDAHICRVLSLSTSYHKNLLRSAGPVTIHAKIGN